MRGLLSVAAVMALLACAPAFALDPVSVPGVGSVSCTQSDVQDPPHETITDSCSVDSSVASADCTRVQSTDGPTSTDCTATAGGTTVDCAREETFLYVSNDDVACAATTADGGTTTCGSDYTNDFFASGDASRTSGCDLGDGTSCHVTTQPATDPDDPVFPVPDGTDPAVTPSGDCPTP
jgi:hypothetical protein